MGEGDHRNRLGQGIKNAGRGAADDQRARALVLAMQPHRRREAIRLFEDLLRQHAPTPEELIAHQTMLQMVTDPIWLMESREVSMRG